MDKYRVLIIANDDGYLALVPEIEGAEFFGETRGAALAKLEEELPLQLATMKDDGQTVPDPVDMREFDGNLSAKVSQRLHRELTFMAQLQGVDLPGLVSEMLTRALGGVVGESPGRARSQGAGGHGRRGKRADGDADREGDGRQRRGGRRNSMDGNRYHNIMENRADFIEYVRNLDRGQGGRGTGGRGDGGRGDGGGRGGRNRGR